MAWNYRIIHHPSEDPDEDCYKVHEVYYNNFGGIIFISKEECGLFGITFEELRADLELHAKAFDFPILELDKIQFAPYD